MYKRVTILLAVVGLVFAIWVVATAKQPIPAPDPSYPPSVNPFGRGIVALGLVESASRDIAIAAPEPGRVQAVHVTVGQVVKAGDPLFTLDTMALEADMLRAVAQRNAAAAELDRQRNWPRTEDLPPLRAAVSEAKSRLDDAADRLRTLEAAAEQQAANMDEVSRQRFAVSVLRNALNQDQANLDRLLAGPWKADVVVAEANLHSAEAEVASIQKRIDRLTVRSPIDATVLKRDIEPGEFTQSTGSGGGIGAIPPLVIGDLRTMHVRAQVDEEDAPLLKLNAPAKVRIRGPYRTELNLRMLRIEPLARAKQQITNAATELVDTRVIDVLFEVEPQSGITLYSGQIVDVYIDAETPTRNSNTTPLNAAKSNTPASK